MTKQLPSTELLVQGILDYYNGAAHVTTAGLRAWCQEVGYNLATVQSRLENYKTGRGKYQLNLDAIEKSFEAPAAEPAGEVKTIVKEYQSLVPQKDPLFVPFGNFTDLKKIIKSGVFFPLFITGLSGNGKTHSVEQACAQLNRDLIRVNITIETDQDDLVGGFRLIDGETVWHNGPVVEAMERGAVLLLDEVDLASNKIMCLQSVLEGKGLYLKKINRWVTPKAGFNVIATANTKGRGSETGKFIGTNVLNEAFLERFSVTFEQEYPTVTVEKKMLLHLFGSLGEYDVEKVVNDLTNWADIIRKTYEDGGVEDVISTRRLLNICRAYVIWGKNINKAIQLSTARFDDDTASVFRELYKKVSGEAEENAPEE